MRDLVFFQNDVVNALLLKLVAHRQSGLAAADNSDADVRRNRKICHVSLPVYS
ncbi:hypothetical protein V1284_007534 [Nitrobacteraceae bacterium AZCC 2299]